MMMMMMMLKMYCFESIINNKQTTHLDMISINKNENCLILMIIIRNDFMDSISFHLASLAKKEEEEVSKGNQILLNLYTFILLLLLLFYL
jgi:hypothetical protein